MLQADCDQFPSEQWEDGIEHMIKVVASDLGNLEILSIVNIWEAGEQRHFKSSDNISKRQKYLYVQVLGPRGETILAL